MAYQDDPGRVFDSDTHRRVLGHLSPQDPLDAGELFARMESDVGTELDSERELVDVLKDLEASGFASETKAGWKQTKRGVGALDK